MFKAISKPLIFTNSLKNRIISKAFSKSAKYIGKRGQKKIPSEKINDPVQIDAINKENLKVKPKKELPKLFSTINSKVNLNSEIKTDYSILDESIRSRQNQKQGVNKNKTKKDRKGKSKTTDEILEIENDDDEQEVKNVLDDFAKDSEKPKSDSGYIMAEMIQKGDFEGLLHTFAQELEKNKNKNIPFKQNFRKSRPITRRSYKSKKKSKKNSDKSDDLEEENNIYQEYEDYNDDNYRPPPLAKASWKALYTDLKSTESIFIDTVGSNLSMKVRGIRLESYDLMLWKVINQLPSFQISSIKLDFYSFVPDQMYGPIQGFNGKIFFLDHLKLEFNIPVIISDQSGTEEDTKAYIFVFLTNDSKMASLSISLHFQKKNLSIYPTNQGIDDQNGQPISFDKQIEKIQNQLPLKLFIKTCWNCAFSEYSTITRPLYGGLVCFRDWPAIENVRDEATLNRNWHKHTEYVQETYLCPSFKRRTKPRIEYYPLPISKNQYALNKFEEIMKEIEEKHKNRNV